MKRKLALLLAVVMSISMLPMNVFASSTNRVSWQPSSLGDETLILERGYAPAALNTSADALGVETVLDQGSNLEIEFGSSAVANNSSFALELSNAEFFFRAQGTDEPDVVVDGAWNTSRKGVDVVDFRGYNATHPAAKTGTPANYRTYDSSNGVWLSPGTAASTTEGVYLHYGESEADIDYIMQVNRGGDSATVVIVSGWAAGVKPILTIPLVILSDSEDDPVTVSITDYGAGVSGGTSIISSVVAGATVTTIADVEKGREDILLETITIRETRSGTIESGEFYIDAPSGYEFTQTNAVDGCTISAVDITIAGPNTVTMNSSSRRITVKLVGVTKTTSRLGRILIDGITLSPLKDTTFGEISGLKITNKSAGITSYTFGVVAERVDYGVNLTAANSKDEIPTLFTGVYEDYADIEDDDADAAKLLRIQLKEAQADSWWTTRETKLTLPEGVLVRAVKVVDYENVAATGIAEDDFVSPGGHTGSTTLITVNKDADTITLKNLKNGVEDGKKAMLQLDIWVSISNRLDGKDIELTVEGGGMSGDSLPAPLVVAKAQAPVTVETKVSTIAIGRNNQAVADIVITETGAGALPENGTVNLLLADQYGITAATGNTELRFVTANVEVTEGDLELKSGAGQVGNQYLSFTVKTDSTEASTITLSDVRINVATTLPSSEKDAYKVLVGGVVSDNYANGGNSDDTKEGYFVDSPQNNCIIVDYLRTGATAGTDGFDPTAPFEITTDPEKGEMYYVIDGEKFGITADKYPKNVNGVVLLSVRLVAEAFGREVGWDPIKGVATIVLSTFPAETVQFTVGSPYYVKNGVEQLMLYDDGVTLATADVYEYEGIGRLFVPMRWLGRAMGVSTSEIQLDGDSGIAYFNRQ